jgi:hypothetical protein
VSIVVVDGAPARVVTVNVGPRGPQGEPGSSEAVGVAYDPAVSGLVATNVQAAIDELRALIGS